MISHPDYGACSADAFLAMVHKIRGFQTRFGWPALIGIALGGAFFGPLGDRFGRRILLVTTMVVVGLASIGTGYATSMTQLFIWRFLTGLGLGASLTNATALTSDYVPSKRRAALVTLMFSGVPIGAFTSTFCRAAHNSGIRLEGLFYDWWSSAFGTLSRAGRSYSGSIKLLLASRPGDPRIPKILAVSPRKSMRRMSMPKVRNPASIRFRTVA